MKILGLRIDPQQVEAVLARPGVTAACVGTDDALVAAATGGGEPRGSGGWRPDSCGLPPHGDLAYA